MDCGSYLLQVISTLPKYYQLFHLQNTTKMFRYIQTAVTKCAYYLPLIILFIYFPSACRASPDYCLLPPERGPCNDDALKYFYSPQNESCFIFWFGGCRANDNVFNDRYTCMDVCTGNDTLDEEEDSETGALDSVAVPGDVGEIREIPSGFETEAPYLVLDTGSGQSTFTFATPSSFIQLGPQEISRYQIRNRRSVSLWFRTRQPHALLVYHGIRNRPTRINKYELYVMLDQGQLKVKHLFGDNSTTLVVGKGLNRDKWHKVNVMIDPGEQTMLARVDDVENTIVINGLKEHYLYGADNDELESIIFIGGLKGGDPSLDISYLANPFVGCVRNITLETSPLKTGLLEPLIPLVTSRYNNVKETCMNKCWEPTMKCSRDSKCINHYDHVVCDCFKAKFKGEKCKDTHTTQLTLNGYSYVTFTVYEWMDRVHSDSNRISMSFQTTSDDSILFYATGEIPFHNHIAASIFNKTVHVHLDFGDGEPIVTNFSYRVTHSDYHKLTILHHGKNVTVQLDDATEYFKINGSHHHFYIDPDIYIGGGGPILKNREGLFSSNNFVGCLKEVYFNEKSILFELHEKSHQARHHGITAPVFDKCDVQKMVPLTVPFAASGFRISNPKFEELTLSFVFKTVEVFGTLAYSEIRTIKGEGFWELKFRYDEIIFELQPDKQIADISQPKNISVKFNKRDFGWNTIDLRYSNGEVTLKTDKQSRVEKYDDWIQLSPFVTLGTSLHNPSTGFLGCIGKVVIGGKSIDARRVIGSEDQIGDISLDNCQFVNPCDRPEVCEHGGKCGIENGGITCQCKDTGYEGKHCHFAMYKRTCEELALLGYTESGVYKIDIDGNGPYPPSLVKCKFENEVYGETKTIVEHNLSNETYVWKPNEEGNNDFKLNLTYREFNPEMLLSLVSQSVQCHQHIKFECYKTKLGLHQYTWFIPADPKASKVVSIGDAKRSTCPCYDTATCAKGEHCNCDAMEERWLSDEGFFSVSDRLGITQMNFIKPTDLAKDAAARVTLGSLECVEANTQRYVVTFKTFGSYLEAPGWKSGDLAFSFRTTRSSAILLYQPLLHPQHNSFSVFLTNDYELTFRFVLSGGSPQKVTVRSSKSLSGGDWQQVWIDFDLHQVRFQINEKREMMNLTDGQQFGPFEGTMYIAGAPAKHLHNSEVQDGLIGCFRGLVMNGQVLDLYSYMKFHKADIVKDCSPSCEPDPCKNGATCQENWGSFTCQCENPWAHYGTLCETDINEDGLTFLSQSSFIKRQSRDSATDPIKGILSSNIYLNLRTYDSSALVLYANDNINNFVQLHIEGGSKVVFSWNEEDHIHQIFLNKKNLNHGHQIQIAVVRNETHTTLNVNKRNITVDIGVSLLTKYSEKPWFNWDKETFAPPRPFAPVSSYHQLFLGGFDSLALKPTSNASSIPGMLGCLRGLKIGNDRIQISDMANGDDVLDKCVMVCDSKPCHNGGICLEDFQKRVHSCECTFTSYYGQNCTEEKGTNFQGESFIRRRFKNSADSVHDIEARFGFSSTNPEHEPIILLTVQIPGQNYSLIFAVNNKGHLILQEQQGSILDGVSVDYQNFVDSSRHSMYYKRNEQETIFMVDGSEISLSRLSSNVSSPVVDIPEENRKTGEVFIGGINDAFPELAMYKRLKGCMANVFVQVSGDEMRPSEEYMGFVKKHPDLVLEGEGPEGIKLGTCPAFSLIRPTKVDSQPNGMQPPSELADWRIEAGTAKKVPLDIKRPEVIESASISFDTMALIFAIFFGILIVSVGMYTYRLNKRYKRRFLEDDDDDDLYFTHRGQSIRYQDPSSTELKYVGYKRNDPDNAVLLANHGNNTQNEPILRNNEDNDDDDEPKKIDEDNASSDTSSHKSNSNSQGSASSLSDTQNIDDKGVKDLELENADELPRIEENTETERDSEDEDALDPDMDDDLLNFELLPANPNAPSSPVYLSDKVRVFESSPLAKIGGSKYQQMKRTSKDSILSLD